MNADFETYEFEKGAYDLVYSAATIQWIPELAEEIDQVYEAYFHVKQKYTCKMEYKNALNFGFTNFMYKEWHKERTLNAEDFCAYTGTHCEHINLEEPYRSKFYEGIRQAILDAGDKITLIDTIPLYLVQKPL